MGERRYKKSYDTDALRRLVGEGKSRAEIAKELGISADAVNVGMRQQNLTGIQKRGRPQKYDVNTLRKYVEEGKSNQEIAEIVGVTPGTVRRWVKECGLLGIRPHGGNNRKPAKEKRLTGKKLLPSQFNADRHLCKTCQYRTSYFEKERGFGCDYWEIEGHSRGCDAEECTKYVKGKRKQKQRKKVM